MNEKKIGYLQIILSGACFGALGFFGKKAFLAAITPGELLALRYSISASLLGLTLLVIKPKSFLQKPLHILSSIALGILGYAFFSSLFFMALTGLSASLTVLLLYTYPVMVTFFSAFFLKENLGKFTFYALLCVSIGIVCLLWGEFSLNKPIFLLYGLGSAFFYSLYILFSQKYLSSMPALPASFYVQFGAGLVLFSIHFSTLQRPLYILSQHFFLIFSMALICSLIAMTLFLAGLGKITSTEASILSTTEPLFGIILASFFLDEKLTRLQFVGGFLIIVGMILTSKVKTAEAIKKTASA